jgi:PIN domain nuclease of toxin-antitoxin system
MKYLIDTHVLLWTIGKSSSLSVKAKEALRESNIYVSATSWWEISIKYSSGKLKLENGTPEDLWKATIGMQFIMLPITGIEASSFYKLDITNKDPFDRMLVWQAIKNDLPLISKDGRLQSYEKFGLQLIW